MRKSLKRKRRDGKEKSQILGRKKDATGRAGEWGEGRRGDTEKEERKIKRKRRREQKMKKKKKRKGETGDSLKRSKVKEF